MNERMRELWDQSRYPSGRGHDEEKFAELIIAECIDQVEVFNARMDAGPRHIVEAIKEHFGVKE